MRNVEALVVSNVQIAADTYEMILEVPAGGADIMEEMRPGMFINIRIEGFYLRRPISVCSFNDNRITIVYKTVGRGTEALAGYAPGAQLDVLAPLGNGYETFGAGERPVLIGGGAGVPPMFGLAEAFTAEGIEPAVVLGFNTADEVFYVDRFSEIGIQAIVATVDGSKGVRGFVTEVLSEISGTSIYTCGPEAMLKAVDSCMPKDLPGQFSFEERMGCGFGACMGCSCETKYGSKRICKDGPILERGEIIW